MRCPALSADRHRCRRPDNPAAHYDHHHISQDYTRKTIEWDITIDDQDRWGPEPEPAPRPTVEAGPTETYLRTRADVYTRAAATARKTGNTAHADAYRMTALELSDTADWLTDRHNPITNGDTESL